MNEIIQVCIPHSGHDYYDYLASEVIPVVGSRVWVTLRGRKCVGIVVGIVRHSAFHDKLKPIVSIVEEAVVLDANLLSLYRWIGQYYHSSLSTVMNFALPKLFKTGRRLPVSSSYSELPRSQCETETPPLNPAQQTAVDAILKKLSAFHCFLIHGVTGSGKTEVYLRLIESVLSQGLQVLVLVPEIGLTPQLINRFHARLPVPVGVIHSHLNDTERYQAWYAGATGHARVILGTRSALFGPLPSLGLIVIDEEHDPSFKQQDSVRYSARDAALMRAKELNIPVVMGSATPSLETYLHAQRQKYTCFKLMEKALSTTPLHYELVDLRTHPIKDGLTEKTLQTIDKHLQAGNQVLVFMNRRGYAPVLLCHDCGKITDCPGCERHFTVHQKLNRMMCHHCGLQRHLPQHCLHCQSKALVYVGAGTQRLFQALVKRFPGVTIAQIDRDELRHKQALEKALEQISLGNTQLMVGTQLLAKGHHFPKLTLVVVVDADAGLYHQDFRASERLGQLILQVAGRAGRENLPGEVLIQTLFPTHPLLLLLIQKGYDTFAQALLAQREKVQLPPFSYVGLIRAKGREPEKVEACLMSAKHHLLNQDIALYGPAPALMFKKAGQYRWQLCLISRSRAKLHHALKVLLEKMERERYPGIRWSIDVDPIELA